MGRALSERLLSQGGRVVGHDIAPPAVAALRAVGGVVVPDPAEVFVACDTVLLSLPSDIETRQVLDAARSALRKGQIILDTTTGDPESSLAIARELAARHLHYLDATISGNSEQLRRGETLWMVGGDRAAFDQCEDLFRRLGGKVVYTGESGSGSRMKLVTNLVLGINRAALAEGLAFAGALGLDARQTLDILRASMAYSRVMDSKGEKMIRGDFEPQARLSQHLKDVRLILDAAAQAGQPLLLTQAHRELLERAELLGLGRLDNSSILKAIESQRGQKAQ